jgi:hypothetical protein
VIKRGNNKMSLYKLNKTLHRDLGYLFVGMILIYAISGVAINHRTDWNPNYIIKSQDYGVGSGRTESKVDMNYINLILQKAGESGNYKNHYFPESGVMTVFIKGGNITVNLETGDCRLETIQNRPLFKEVNLLHYNPGRIWTWFSDIFCVALAFLAISGLFILKGKYGLVWRGAILTAIGILIPLLLLLLYI